MPRSKTSLGAISLAFFLAMPAGAAFASCGKGKIEVEYAGQDTCVAPEQFKTLSDAVKATASEEDVAEATEEVDDDEDSDKGETGHAGEGGDGDSDDGDSDEGGSGGDDSGGSDDGGED